MILQRIAACSLVCILAVVFPVRVMCAPTSYLPNDHRVYYFLERMEARGFIDGVHLGTRPMTRNAAAHLLVDLEEYQNSMPAMDLDEFQCLLDELRPDIEGSSTVVINQAEPLPYLPVFIGENIYTNRQNLFSTGGDDFSLYLDPVMVRTATLGDAHEGGDDNVYIASNGFRIRGTVGDHIGLFIDVRDASESGSRDYPETVATTMPGRGFVTLKGDHAEFDETHAHITYANGPFTVTFGRGNTAWGRGSSGGLGLTAYSAPVDFLRLEAAYWRLKFVFLTAELEQHPPVAKYYYAAPADASTDSVTVQKRFSAHRLEIDLSDRLALGLYEMVIYGGRYEWSYLNPLMFLKGAEHANGDHDNAAMGMDIRYLPGYGLSLYGELFIDDISTTKLGTDWYGNKFAMQAGMFFDRPLGIDGLDARLEYTRINPWVYTHRFTINTYTHYGDVLGNRIGPNADLFTLALKQRFTRRLGVSAMISRHRHGANLVGLNVGGDPLDGFSPGDSKHASFLAGNVSRTMRYDVDISYELAWNCFVQLGLSYEDIDGDGISMMRAAFRLND